MYDYNYKIKIDGIPTTLKFVHNSGNSYQYNTLNDSGCFIFNKPLKQYGYNKPFRTSGHLFELLPNKEEKSVTLTESEFKVLIEKHAFFISSNNFLDGSKNKKFLKMCETLFV